MGMFDDLIEQVQSTPQPASVTVPQPPPVEESPLDSAGRALGNTVTLGQAPNIGGAVNYVMEGGAPGSFDQGYQRSVGATENSQAQNPDAYSGGNIAGAGLLAAIPGSLAARVPALTGMAIRYGLRSMGFPVGGKAIEMAIEHGPKLAAALRATSKPPEQAGPGSGALSAEMRAALKRGKFRHQYNNVKGGI